MRTCKWTMLVSCVVGLAGCPEVAENELPASPQVGEDGATQGLQAVDQPPRCTAKPKLSAVAMPDVASLTTGCPHNFCGLNGTWLGAGVAFRELHLNGGVNAQNLQIIDFQDRHNVHLRINVDRDVLQGKTSGGIILQGDDLRGARLFISTPNRTVNYVLTITAVSTQDSWTGCATCAEPLRQVPIYEFTAINTADGCQVEVCRPGLAPDYPGGLIGRAVIYRGDYYDDAYTVRSEPAPDRMQLDNDLFNIACSGTSLYKLHLLRHTSAAASVSYVTSVDERQTLLRLLAADYCGIGHPFTEDGLPIELGFGNGPYGVTPDSGYPISSPSSIDAYWHPTGASCLATPRLARSMTPSEIKMFGDSVRAFCPWRMVADGCDTVRPAGDYATSANP